MWGCSLEHEGKQEEECEDLKARGLASPAPSGPGAAGRGRCGPGAAPPFPHGGQPGPGVSSAALKAAAAETLSEITRWGIKPTPPRSGGRLPSLSRLFIDLAVFFTSQTWGARAVLNLAPNFLSFTPLHAFSLHPPSK